MSSPRMDRLPAARLLPHLGVMLAVAAVLGVVVAGLAIPFAGVAGIGARNIARSMDDLPAQLETGDLAQRTRILDSQGKLITTLYDENRINRPLSQISRNMTQALVSIEDYRFYQHGALDLKGTLRAFVTNQANNGTVQGGSSITQQLVKMTLVQQAKESGDEKAIKAATEDSYARKIKELRYAIALEQTHSKDWILERYLNAAYFGDGAYGVQAAAKHYFDVNANNLSLTQAATLAGLVKNPTGYDPTNSPDRALARRNVVLDRMAQLHVISAKQADAAKAAPLGLHVQSARNGCVNSTAPFFCDYVVNWLLKSGQLPGRTEKDRMEYLQSGGFTIKTTLDLRFQKAADDAVAAHVAPTDQAIGALAMVEPGSGNVKGLSQSRPMGRDKKKGETYLNYVTPQEYGDSNGFQAGSTFKLFVLSSAIEYNGFPLHQQINSPPEKDIPESNYKGCPGDGNRVGIWQVHNSTDSGMMDAYSGTRLSVNTFFAQLEEITGLCNPYKLAKSMGLELTDPSRERVPTFTLGVPSVSPLEMAEAYATVAARGLHCNSRPVTEIDDEHGKPVKQYPKSCQQVMAQGTADAVNDILRGVQEPGGFGGDAGLGLSVPSAAKTGTINDNMTVWYDGYTPALATASMIAGANSKGEWITLNGQHLKGGYVVTAHGSTTAGPMWGDAMHVIQQWLPDDDFVKPDPSVIAGVQVDVPSVSGMSISHAKDVLHKAGFRVNVGSDVYSSYSVGTVAYSSPSDKAAKGSPITIYPSAGPQPQPKRHKKRKQHGGAPSPPIFQWPGNGHGHGHHGH